MEDERKDIIHIPDPRFFDYLAENFVLTGDGEISVEEAKSIREIVCPAAGIQSLEGIEYFENLTRLDCPLNRLISLDISKNTKLAELDCRFNFIGELDLSNSPVLRTVFTKGNRLKILDLSYIQDHMDLIDADNDTKLMVEFDLPDKS